MISWYGTTRDEPDHLLAAQWPTLGALLDSGKRVIVFLDAGADVDRSVPYILPEFEMASHRLNLI